MRTEVIIPAYNAAGTLCRAVQSALGAGADGVIVVNDGSTDDTRAVLSALMQDGRVRAVHQENRGVSAARNAGMDALTGDLVAFLDADDELLPGALTALVQAMGDADAIQGRIVRGRSGCGGENRAMSSREILAAAMSEPTRHLLCHGWLFRRAALTERFNEALSLGEDGEWMLRTLAGVSRAAFSPVAGYRYHLNPASAVHAGKCVVRRYRETLLAAKPALEKTGMPQAAALYRLTHLLLMLTHGVFADGGGKEAARQARALCHEFDEDFRRAELTGPSPRMLTLRLLRRGWYGPAFAAVRFRRWMNMRASEGAGRSEEQ